MNKLNKKPTLAHILDEFSLVLSVGSENGVESGMRFGILDHIEDIHDPETEELIGKIALYKVRVKVSRVRPKFCICYVYVAEGGVLTTGASLSRGDEALLIEE